MSLTNTQLRNYDANVLRLPAVKRKEYHAQVDYLVSELSAKLRDKTKIKITRVVKAGSFAKFTILRKTNEDPVDVDLVFYIAGRTVDAETRKSLLDTIYDLLVEVYLRIVLSYTDAYTSAARQTMKPKLNINWTPTDADTSHATLQPNGGRDYVSNGWGLQRKDFRK